MFCLTSILVKSLCSVDVKMNNNEGILLNLDILDSWLKCSVWLELQIDFVIWAGILKKYLNIVFNSQNT